MVVFTCNACGESVKKAQVEKHVNICRNCQCLSCMDCGKDFWGDDYKEHVKCVSEDQKYGGKDFEAKTNKGDAKQQEWIQKIHEVMKKPNISPKVRNILEQMRVFDNIPRKKVKFQNWMKNSLRITDSTLQDQVWDIFSEATRNISSEKEQDKPQQKEEQQSAETGEKTMAEENGITNDKTERKKNKRERKEERQKNKKKEKKDLKLENPSEVKKSKKSKKGKESLENEFEINGNGHESDIEEEANVKKRKHKHAEEEPHITTKRMKTENISEDMETENTNGNEENVGTVKGKFNWKGTIKAVLKQAPDNEISIKKLRKKVIAQYYTVAGEHHKSEEDILVIFNKKVNNNPKFKVLKDKVKLLK
ncbi:cell growth-regulating nucleolar protein isoform X1 [Grus americana]|uniref:cell growth-regulating nucleolar protein isoform X1 n=1 Tax=Grus americana TaxID=9117 RepID=UPI002408539B|nr:cell growth-regulating nucleolar protein isoform X1 [Grus americana]XP_054679571.1 cell growth-regulating nucleolar protein isoform X1 [Grus americana]XP_054679573.1 cell growth-regulating nucleolar protein isoform X1 [Grus americana]XP_054679574.1 cell growth-regulating nucleolar protein isoform X1 [Grus americana]